MAESAGILEPLSWVSSEAIFKIHYCPSVKLVSLSILAQINLPHILYLMYFSRSVRKYVCNIGM